MTAANEDAVEGFSSPPCSLHEVDPLYAGLAPKSERQQRQDVLRWRRSTREQLVARRLALAPDLRRRHADRIAGALDTVIGDVTGLRISLYWPFRGEPDLRFWIDGVIARGALGALPVVEQPRAPLVFRAWRSGDALVPGVWNIPVPAAGAAVVPDVIIAPLVGFDPAGYRLGYGGGYYDRTLAALPCRPRVVGVGFAVSEIATIYPLPHDIAMDAIVTEDGVRPRAPSAP
jgi:5-formyltetrahydrofolate cyclo-ligase